MGSFRRRVRWVLKGEIVCYSFRQTRDSRRSWPGVRGRRVGLSWSAELRRIGIVLDLHEYTMSDERRNVSQDRHPPVIIRSASALLSRSSSRSLSAFACVSDDRR